MGNPKQGGTQTLKEKMNLADEEKSFEDLEDIASIADSTPNVSEQIRDRVNSAGQSSVPESLPEDNEIEEL